MLKEKKVAKNDQRISLKQIDEIGEKIDGLFHEYNICVSHQEIIFFTIKAIKADGKEIDRSIIFKSF